VTIDGKGVEMAISDEVLAQINQLLNRLNAPEKKGITFSGIFRHPIVITVVGSALIAYASNFIGNNRGQTTVSKLLMGND